MPKTPVRLSDFSKSVINQVQQIPPGRVATYGQIASLAKRAHAARGVGWILSSCSKSHNLPWHRVVNVQGRISFPTKSPEFREQKRLLKMEGIKLTDHNRIDLQIYQWQKFPPREKKSRLKPQIFR